ncbi:unnamed protein product [Mytilus coruscus]|uniref:Uncharacterized protein n=1 Tax=Mytilus coruscus TaxID=42192 RepID=A0A6J8BTY9_MYTCO|nr:unnamed protein product [Mytilus coruscus]
MICEKLSNIDKLADKLNKFDKSVTSMVKSVESINKRVDEVEKGLNFINTEFEMCRFVNFKQRELVRKAASELKGTKYGINEQFPKEINDRRKVLWPHFQEARRQRKKAFFKRDRLFIDGNEFLPKDNTHVLDTDDRQTRSRHQQSEQGARPKEFNQPKYLRPRGGPRKGQH